MLDSSKQDKSTLFADGMLTVPEAATFLSLSRSQVYAIMEAGHLCYVKLGRSRRIPKRALIDLAQANLRGGWKVGD
jgi:excisionase family DNA binding protein